MEIPKKRYISPEKRQQITDDLSLVQQYNNGISKNNKFVRQNSKSRTKSLGQKIWLKWMINI